MVRKPVIMWSLQQNLEEDAGKIMVTVEDGDSKLKELIGAQEAQSLR